MATITKEFRERCFQEIRSAFHSKTTDHATFFDLFLETKKPHTFSIWNAVIWMIFRGVKPIPLQAEIVHRFLDTMPDPQTCKLENVTKLDAVEMLIGLQRKRNYNVIPCDYWDEYWSVHEDMVTAAIIKWPKWREHLPNGIIEQATDIARMSSNV